MRTFLILGLLSAPLVTQAQSWTNRYNGTGDSFDVPLALHVDSSGNVYVTGESVNTPSPSQGWQLVLNDFATIKYSAAGVPQWTNRFNGDLDQSDGGTAIAVDIEGNVVVTGFTETATGRDFATIKYSSSGIPIWTNYYDGPWGIHDSPVAITVDPHGDIFVSGETDFNVWPEEEVPSDITTIKYSSAGVPLWINRYDGPANLRDAPIAASVDPEGNVIVAGSSAVPDPSSSDLLGSAIVVLKYSGQGVPLWTNRYEGDGTAGEACWTSALAVDLEGNVLIAGLSARGTQQDFVTLKYSAGGGSLWTHRTTAAETSDAWVGKPVLAVDGQGDAVVVMGFPSDYLAVKYSALGEVVWTNRISRQPDVYPQLTAVAVDDDQNSFVAVLSNELRIPNQTPREITLIHYSAGGQPVATNRYDDSSIYLWPIIAVDRDGNLLLAGDSPAESSGSPGVPDYAVYRYAAPPTPPRLEIQWHGDDITLTWLDAAFGLQSAPALDGSFTNIPDAVSPYTTPAQGAHRYFRLASEP